MKAKHWLLFFAGLYLAVFGGLATIGGTGRGPLFLAFVCLIPFAAIAALFAVLFGLLFATIAFHELGHYLMGRAVKFHFYTVVVGPIGLRVQKDRVVPFRVKPARNGGYVVMMPPDDRNFGGRFALFIIGGPLFSLIWVGASMAIWPMFGYPILGRIPAGTSIESSMVHLLLSIWTLVAITVLISSLIPYTTKSGLSSDCLRLIQLARKDRGNQRILALLTLQRLTLSGVRVRDLPAETIRLATEIQDGTSSEMIALQFRWAYELTHDRRATEATLDRLLQIAARLNAALSEESRSSLAQIQALQAVFIRHDPDSGEALLAQAKSSTPTALASRATLSAGIAAIRRSPELKAKIDAASQAVETASATTSISYDWEREWLDNMAKGWPPMAESPDAKPPMVQPPVAYPRST